MDPYLEKHWGSVHQRLVTYTCDALQPQLPSDLWATMEERVYLEGPTGSSQARVPDNYIAERKSWPAPGGGNVSVMESSAAIVAAPIVFQQRAVEVTEGYIEIRDRSGDRIITVIEFLSPANKLPGSGRKAYLEKREEVLGSDASLVEIDLVRAGERLLDPAYREDSRIENAAYLATTHLGWDFGVLEVYPFKLREPLPQLPIPLRQTDERVLIDLQAMIDKAYELGRYDRIDYSAEPDPPLPEEDAAWAREVCAA